MRRFELVEGKSSKFWQITLDGQSFTVQWGRIGTDGQSQVKEWPSVEKAKAEHDKLVAEKVKKGYGEVGAPEAPAEDEAAPAPAAKPKPKPRPPAAPVEAPAADGSGFVDAGGGYGLGVRDGAIVARNDKGKVLASVPKPVKETEAYEILEGALELLERHAVECKETIETWMLRTLPVPVGVVKAVWADPDWRGPLENLVVDAGDVVGLLRAVEARGLGVVDLDGDTRWSSAESIRIPHPILLGELDEWRSLLAELGIAQGTPQLFRETFTAATKADERAVHDFGGGEFDMLLQAYNEARKLGYRVSGGCSVCRVWEGGRMTEARYYLGEGDPMYETSTGDLSFVDERQQTRPLAEVGPISLSEGMRMASAIFAKRKIAAAEGEDDV